MEDKNFESVLFDKLFTAKNSMKTMEKDQSGLGDAASVVQDNEDSQETLSASDAVPHRPTSLATNSIFLFAFCKIIHKRRTLSHSFLPASSNSLVLVSNP